jgi:hypothetical protein
MPYLRTLNLTLAFDVVREAMTHTSVVEYGDSNFSHQFNRAQRPAYRFNVRLDPMVTSAAEALSAFHAFHQGAKSFMWNGGKYGTINNYNLFGEGNGSQRQFFLQNRYVTSGTLAIQTRNQASNTTSAWATSAYSATWNPGIVTFNNSVNTIPASGHDIEAKYSCFYRVVFEPNGLKMSEFASGVFKVEMVLKEVFFFDGAGPTINLSLQDSGDLGLEADIGILGLQDNI